jgi:hypothetical protein
MHGDPSQPASGGRDLVAAFKRKGARKQCELAALTASISAHTHGDEVAS